MQETRGRHEAPERTGRHERVPDLLPWHNLAVPASGDGPTLGDRTPPVPWQAFTPQQTATYYPAPRPVQPTSAGAVLARVAVVALIAFVSLILGALLLLIVALIAGPPPAEASAPPQVRNEQLVVAGDSVQLVVEELCPAEDDCTIDYRGSGRWVITRVEH